MVNKRFLAGAALACWRLLGQPAATISPSTPVHTATIDGQIVTYEVRDEYAIVQGDIIIGLARDLESGQGSIQNGRDSLKSAGRNFLSASPARWPNATMAYVIDADVPNPSRILAAIDHWTTRTPFSIVSRTTEPNYVRFRRGVLGDNCSSSIGMVGGAQTILLEDGCSTGNVIHEIGHAWGLLHEQARNDRNANMTVLFENIDKRASFNFNQNISTTQDQGYYDFDSIMHYGFRDFSNNGQDTLESVPLGIPFGQRTNLSAGDIDGISRLYLITPQNTTVTTEPAGLPIVVDGVSGVSPQSFPWAPGSTHTISVSAEFGTDPHYRLVRWSDGGNATHEVSASSSRTVFAAVFQRLRLASVAVSSGNGTVSILPPSPDGYYPERMPLRITAVPGPGSKLYTWSGTSVQANGTASETANVEVLVANSRFTAAFTTQTVTTIDSEPRGLPVQVDLGTYLTPVRFLWTAGSSHTLSVTAEQTGSSATSQFRFQAWEDGGTQTLRTITAGASDTTLKATFQTRYLLSILTSGPGIVTASPPSPDGFYDANTEVQLTALPNGGGVVLYWLGDLLGDGLLRTIKMDQQRSVAAGFGSPITFAALSNAGTYQFSPVYNASTPSVAPGEIAAVFAYKGNVIGPASPTGGQVQSGKVTTSLAGTRVLFDGVAAPILYASQDFVLAVVPSSISGKTLTVAQVERNGVLVNSGFLHTVQETFPGIFTANVSGSGQISAINEDFSPNSVANPAAPGSIVSFYATGGGLPETPVPDGQVMGSDLVRLKSVSYVRVGKLPAEVLYAGSIPTLVNGALLVQIRLPKEILGGPAVPIQVIFGNYASPPGTTIAIR